MKTRFFLFLIGFFMISCGATTSISKIMKASEARDHAFKMIVASYGLSDRVSVDEFGYKTFDKSVVNTIKPIEQREALYYYFLGEALLEDARELQSGAIYERSEMLADKSIENSNKAIKTASAFLNRNRKVTKTVKKIEKRLTKKHGVQPAVVAEPKSITPQKPVMQPRTQPKQDINVPIAPKPIKPAPQVKQKPAMQPQKVQTSQPAVVQPTPIAESPKVENVQPTSVDVQKSKTEKIEKKKEVKKAKKAEEKKVKKEKKTGYADMYEKLRKEAAQKKENKEKSGTTNSNSGGAK